MTESVTDIRLSLEPSAEADLPPLPLQSSPGAGRPLRICIASSDLVGPVRNGGVGTAFTAMGVALAGAGHEVTLLYVGGDWCENGELTDWIEHYRQQRIDFVPLPRVTVPRLDAPWHMIKAYETYEWLKRNDRFDVMYFSEWLGNGYYAMLAKKQGLYFQNSLICVNTHGPSLWHKLNNADFIYRTDDLEVDFMERESVTLADMVISPSQYLVRWMRGRGWKLPRQAYVQQYVMPHTARREQRQERVGVQPIEEVVFFGRLEVRKGLVLFCDALDRLAASGAADARSFRLTFLGKIALIEGRPADQYVRDRASEWPWEPEIITDLDQTGVMRYLEQPGRLAVIPSMADNLPNTVLECLGGQIPFVASDAGGIPEMIAPDDHPATCFALRPTALAQKLEQVLRNGIRPARPAVDSEENEQAWVSWHRGLIPPTGEADSPRTDKPEPLVSICMPHYNRPDYLRQALASLRALDYSNYEIILVDDGSTTPEALAYLGTIETEFSRKGWKLLRQPNRFPGAARNHAVQHARGDYLFFMDDDNCAKPHELTTLVRAATRSGADILTCFSDIATTRDTILPTQMPRERWLCLGSAVSAGPFRNVFGDTNSLVRREVFLALGGFHEEYGVGMEDWELFAKAALHGYRVEVVPEALFWYRYSGEGVNTTTPAHANMMRVLTPYFEAVPESLRELLLMTQGLKVLSDQMRATIEAYENRMPQIEEHEALLGAARTLAGLGDTDTACKVYSASMKVAHRNRDGVAALDSLLGSAELFTQLGQHEVARESLLAAEKIADQIQDRETLDRVRSTLANLPVDPVVGTAPFRGATQV